AKPETAREAVARAIVKMKPATLGAVRRGNAPKGDVLGTARTAGILAAKRTSELIPLCHPLRLTNVDVTFDDRRGNGTLEIEARVRTTDNTGVVSPEAAAETDIARYHTREYMDVLKRADSGLDPADGAVYGLGLGDNPVFRGLWEVAQLVAAGSLTAADLVASGAVERAFHFAGGLHHAFPDRASGFCYVNDAVLAILRLREHGLRVAYI